ncbi:precorrin-3B synthase [Bosea lathyri]|uniref:Precorrin-3B synthase n=1 Tax=Bosea lathyri TaxID=1036778 RepID=A0A1H6D6Y0_9HYPH|nr:precorrin-3B synthase [Bosea lathyri]SEG80505.1 precorrin-3B synthase [Bosea lathyri]
MSAPAQDELRRGWCPSTLRPMETGDGWLVRLHPPGARLDPTQMRRIAALARQHGNGLVEISARGNLQIRGVKPQAHPALVASLLAEQLVDEHDGQGPQRLTLVSPLAGDGAGRPLSPHPEERRRRVSKDGPDGSGASGSILRDAISKEMAPQDEGSGERIEPVDAAALAEVIEAVVRGIADLPAKTCVVVDDGGALSLDGFPADIRVQGIAGKVAIGLPGAIWLGPIEADAAADVTARLLAAFAAHHRHALQTIRRLRDLPEDALAALVAASGLPRTHAPAPRPAAKRAGLFTGHGGRFAAIIGLPFGRSDAATLDLLCAMAESFGDGDIRLSPWRGIAFRGLRRSDADALLGLGDELGLITDDDDPRLSVQACAGKPACLRAQTPTMADAALLAQAATKLLAGGLTMHVSGCVKSCAHPGPSALTLVGRDGHYDVVIDGTTRDAAFAELDLCEIMTRLQPGQDIHARLVAAGRVTGP